MFIVISRQIVFETNKFYRIEKKIKVIEIKFVRKRGERVHAEVTTSSKITQRNGGSQYAKAYSNLNFIDVQFP